MQDRLYRYAASSAHLLLTLRLYAHAAGNQSAACAQRPPAAWRSVVPLWHWNTPMRLHAADFPYHSSPVTSDVLTYAARHHFLQSCLRELCAAVVVALAVVAAPMATALMTSSCLAMHSRCDGISLLTTRWSESPPSDCCYSDPDWHERLSHVAAWRRSFCRGNRRRRHRRYSRRRMTSHSRCHARSRSRSTR